MASYYQQAQQQTQSAYDKQVQNLKNQLASNQQNLDMQKGGINANYDQQVSSQNLNNVKNKNNISNTMLGRGLGNSSVVTSGLAEANNMNTRLVGNINTARTGALNDIEAQKSLLAQNMNGTIGQMDANRENDIMKLAYQLEDRDWDKNFKNTQLNYDKQYKDAQLGYQQQQLAMQQANADAERAYKQQALAFQQKQYEDKMKDKELSPQDMLADLRTSVRSVNNAGALSAVAQNYATRYANNPAMSYVVKEAQDYANNNDYYYNKWFPQK